LAIGVYWWQQGGWQGRLIEVDQLPVRIVAFKIDVNAAPWTELSQAPEIGETLAKRIVEYREKHGPFANIEALLHVSGIGPRTLEQMRPYLKEITPPAAEGP
jgi:competence ComEA-like helix-hairpin-helix protein